MRIAVAGGTGVVGWYVVRAVTAAGHEPVVLARSRGVDLTTGTGLDAALEGAQAVIDVSNLSTTSRKRSVAFFSAAGRQLLAAGRRAGIAHHAALSVVGIDRVDFGYYEGKRRQEELALNGSVPASILRSTQFFEFAGQLLARGPVVVVPRMHTQPIAAQEVADALVTLALGPAVGRAPELAGPEELQMVDMVREVRRARGVHTPVLPVRIPGRTGRAMAGGALLPTAPGPRGRQTFAEWLAFEDR